MVGFVYSYITRASSAALSKNPFVETALSYALTYISSILPSHLIKPTRVTILADNDYYSQPSSSLDAPPSISSSNPTTKTFKNFNVRLNDAHKTGLGSSAALVTAFTGALLTHYLPSTAFKLSSPSGEAILHNLSQASHCAAQGKIGSGFDGWFYSDLFSPFQSISRAARHKSTPPETILAFLYHLILLIHFQYS